MLILQQKNLQICFTFCTSYNNNIDQHRSIQHCSVNWSTQQKPEAKENMKTFLIATLKRISTEKLKISKGKTEAITR